MTNEKFLGLQLGSKDKAVLPLQYVTEVKQVPLTEICSVPQMPACVVGIYNWRSEMLWMVDLDALLGYSPLYPDVILLPSMMAVVIQAHHKFLGLLVRKITDIELFDLEQINPVLSQLLSAEISQFSQGYFFDKSQEMIVSLDVVAILQADLWKHHQK